MLPDISALVREIVKDGLEGYTYLADGILVGQNVVISPHSEIKAPAIIGHGTEIRIGAYIRGNAIIGEGCVIGNSCEVKNSILLNGVKIPHYNYVGDSILGTGSHLGAGVICSNLKNDGSEIAIHGDIDFYTGMRKVGAMIGDGVNVGCGCVLNPGTVIGKNTNVYSSLSVRGVIPPNRIVKTAECLTERI